MGFEDDWGRRNGLRTTRANLQGSFSTSLSAWVNCSAVIPRAMTMECSYSSSSSDPLALHSANSEMRLISQPTKRRTRNCGRSRCAAVSSTCLFSSLWENHYDDEEQNRFSLLL